MTENGRLAGATLAHLMGLGANSYVVCAGARNAPLVLGLLSVKEEKNLSVWHHFDERTAAFFALGMAKKNDEPTVVVTTSGTAAAELLPAVIEAYYTGVPLIVVTADRPARFRGSGAPQSIEQAKLYGPYAPTALDLGLAEDLSAVEEWDRGSPLHLNICLEEPSPQDRVESVSPVSIPSQAIDTAGEFAEQVSEFLGQADRLIVLLGEIESSWREDVLAFLVEMKAPVWAEASSGLREHPDLKVFLLPSERAVGMLNPTAILRIGGVPSLRFWRDLEGSEEIEVLSISRRPFSGLARSSRMVVTGSISELVDSWMGALAVPIDLDQDSRSFKDPGDVLERYPASEPAMLRALSESIPPDALVYLGNSLPIREWNLAASVERPHPHTFASRGANGIDGQIATWLGLSVGEDESWAILGDLTAMYDLNAPTLLPQIGTGRRRLVVLNNGGGRIFSRLPSLSSLANSEKEVTENHHATRFEALAEWWGTDYLSIVAGDEVPDITGENVLIEVILDQEASELFWRDWTS